MKSLAHMLISIQDIANNFEGGFTLKNAQGKYFYANENWLKLANCTHEELVGKTDDEIFEADYVAFVKKTDQQAFETNEIVQYTNTMTMRGLNITYLALKWVVKHQNGEVFCYCTMGDLVENKDRVLIMQPKIQEVINAYLQEDNDNRVDDLKSDIEQ